MNRRHVASRLMVLGQLCLLMTVGRVRKFRRDYRRYGTHISNVGVSLLAMTECQSTFTATDSPLSRAGSLPQD
ncbi:hypothetical protein EAH78_30900 [Pseudomonas arsenicoxydans]|uniref:Uncharacterized protein n=1 Tax=Pseudomonas arsenicoxydans TaxID=702115 RepID=A0A502GV79_9PSED|nr:hypothetical protein EAH78_30900 [Pseudomonas arsenicoxydans]